MVPQNRLVALATFVSCVLVVSLLSLPRARDRYLPTISSQWPFTSMSDLCTADRDILEQLDLTGAFNYGRRCIRVTSSKDTQRSSLQNNSRSLLPQRLDRILTKDFQQDECGAVLPQCRERLSVVVPRSKTKYDSDTSSLMVGASTTSARLNASLPQMARWLANTQTKLVVIIADSSNSEQFQEVQSRAHALNIAAKLLPNPLPEDGDEDEVGQAPLHFAIARALYTHRTPTSEWFAVIDDDTFFPSLPALLDALSPYDPRQSWYIGALSEDWVAIRRFAHMAYGGAGTLFSLPLLETIYDHFDECFVASYEGDGLYRDCVFRHTSPPVQLTILPGLHQMDFSGEIAGWYESGINPLLSIHHYNSWHNFPVEYAHQVTDITGAASFLQRYSFSDNTVLTNGYSIAQYPMGLDAIDLNRVEQTFLMEEDHNFDWSLGALRPALEEGMAKFSWRLERSVVAKDGSIRQFYVRRADNTGIAEYKDWTLDSVIELDWSR